MVVYEHDAPEPDNQKYKDNKKALDQFQHITNVKKNDHNWQLSCIEFDVMLPCYLCDYEHEAPVSDNQKYKDNKTALDQFQHITNVKPKKN